MHKIIKTIKTSILVMVLAYAISVLTFYAGSNPIDLGRVIGSKAGSAMGVSLSIEENPYNKAALQLAQKEEGLEMREKDLAQAQAELLASNRNYKIILMTMSFFIMVLFFLIIINYYLDYRRRNSGWVPLDLKLSR